MSPNKWTHGTLESYKKNMVITVSVDRYKIPNFFCNKLLVGPEAVSGYFFKNYWTKKSALGTEGFKKKIVQCN